MRPGQSFGQVEAVLQGQQMVEALQKAGLGPEAVVQLWQEYQAARAAEASATFET
ncbi:helicase ATP-binding domain-containing protein, partial [Haematococcus lacustris]